MAIIVVEDLLFRAKIQAAAGLAGAQLQTPPGADEALALLRATPGALLIIDLNHSRFDPVQLIRAIREAAVPARVVGFCSHVDTGLAAQAREAGCDVVLPRSAFVKQLPELLQGSPA